MENKKHNDTVFWGNFDRKRKDILSFIGPRVA